MAPVFDAERVISREELLGKVWGYQVAEKFREAAHNESCPDCRERMLESIVEKPGNA